MDVKIILKISQCLQHCQQKTYEIKKKIVIFVKKDLNIKMLKINNIVKLGAIIIIQGNREVLHIAYVIWNILYQIVYQKDISIIFYSGSNDDCRFITKK